jgi:hypothetical protein
MSSHFRFSGLGPLSQATQSPPRMTRRIPPRTRVNRRGLSVFARGVFSSYSNRRLCRILLIYAVLTTKSVHRPAWRSHPKLKARLLGEQLDELLVVVHDGGPLLTKRRPEVVRVQVTAYEGEVFRGRVLHQPIQLHTVRLGQVL